MKTNAAFHGLPLVEPTAYGRECAGTRSVITSHESATATYAAPAPRSRKLVARLPSLGSARNPSHAISASGGNASQLSASFTLKAMPSTAAAPMSQPAPLLCSALTTRHSASVSSAIMIASVVSLRAVITSIGSTASAAADAIAARAPNGARSAR